jgi:hypothetical protein
LVLTTVSLLAGSASAQTPVSINALGWMTGSWSGPIGSGQTLEENWISPAGGSIASLVRITSADATPMVELIVVEEADDTLVLHIQQWNPGMTPRTPEPQVMVLSELGERQVKFTATGAGGMKTLAYSNPSPGKFVIDIETADGNQMQIPLQSQSR